MKLSIISIIVVFIFFSCGNPSIIRYLSPEGSISSQKHPLRRNFLIYDKDGVRIYINNAGMKEIRDFSILGNMDQVQFRIPSFTYLKFLVENRSDKIFKINFFNTKLKTSTETIYPIITEKEFKNRFTSIAYTNFKFDKIFSFYTVLRKGKKPKKETYFESFRPDTEVSVKPGDLGVQLIPFELISEQHLEYILTLPVETLPDPLEIPLKYIIYRQDFKKFQKKGK